MCRPSTVTDDWVVKGCHIHVDGIEIGVCPSHSPNYLDGIVFKRIFSTTPAEAFRAAAKKAREDCLSDATVRGRWRRSLKGAMEYVRSFSGEPAALANGRQYEFHRLIRHLDIYEVRNGDAQ